MEMYYKLTRIFENEEYTIGKLFKDGVYQCDTIEDAVRTVKIQDKTAIPAGKYQVIVNHSNRFNRMLPLLLNVPGFDGIRIHNGINENSTSGCIIVGENKIKGQVTNSTYWMGKICDDMLNAQNKGIKISIEIV